MRVVLDLEGDGLLDTIENIHCLSAKDINTQRHYRFYDGDIGIARKKTDLYLKDIPRLINAADLIIGHNVIGYDLLVLEKFFGISQTFEIRDTYFWSKTLYPDRPMPQNCPPVLWNPVTEKYDRIGPHSLAAWGYRVGKGKPEYYDWAEFDEGMLKRCDEDVLITELVDLTLLKEANLAEKTSD